MFDVNWETRSHADIHAQLQGRGAGFTDAGGAWNSLATRLRDVAGSVERATSGIAATRTGPAAQAAGAAVGPMGPWADEVRGFSDAVGSASHEQNRALAATRSAVGPPVARPPVTLQTWEGVGALAALDVDSAENTSLDAERRARAAMGRYQEFSSLRASGLPQFSSPAEAAPRIQLVAGGGAVPAGGGPGPVPVGTTTGAAAGTGATGGSATSGGGPTPGGATSPGGGTAAGVPAAGGAGPGPRPGTTAGGAAGSGVAGSGAAGGGAAGGGAGASAGGPTGGGAVGGGAVAGGVATGGAAAGSGRPPGTGFGTGATLNPTSGSVPSGTVPSGTGTGTGTGPGSALGSTRPALGGITGSGEPPAFGPTGTGSSSATASRVPVEPTRLGGASVLEPALGPRNTGTQTGVPFAPIGGVGGTGAADQRLPRASYLVEDDPDALAGELPRVAPPVIGE